MFVEPQTSLDVLPAFCRARILILGVGNILFGDDGFGPAVAETLLRQYIVPDDIYIMDVGTGVRKLLFTLTLSETKPDEIVVVDAVDWGNNIGHVAEIAVDDLPITKVDDFSLHQVPTSNMLRELKDECGVRVTVVGCDVGVVPQMIAPGLSPDVERAVAITVQSLVKRFSLQGCRLSC